MKERVKELCKMKGVSMNTAEKEIGVAKGYISKLGKSNPNMTTLQKIADYFGVSIDYLMASKEDQPAETMISQRNERDIKTILSNTEQLLKQDGLMFDGEPASQEAIDSILSAMRIGMEIASEKNRQRFTPKKYKKD